MVGPEGPGGIRLWFCIYPPPRATSTDSCSRRSWMRIWLSALIHPTGGARMRASEGLPHAQDGTNLRQGHLTLYDSGP